MSTATARETTRPAADKNEKAAEYVMPFSAITLDDLSRVGGKNASLGELIKVLAPRGIRVPDGFAITADAFRLHLKEAGLDSSIYTELDQVDVTDVSALATLARSIRGRVAEARLPDSIVAAVDQAYEQLSRKYGEDATDVAVRSSATAEDLPSASFAGQQETYLNVHGRDALNQAIRACMASLFTDRAIVYRTERGFAHQDVALSVGVQKMVRSDLGAAGVIFTLDTESGFRDVVLITGAPGDSAKQWLRAGCGRMSSGCTSLRSGSDFVRSSVVRSPTRLSSSSTRTRVPEPSKRFGYQGEIVSERC